MQHIISSQVVSESNSSITGRRFIAAYETAWNEYAERRRYLYQGGQS